MTSGVSRSRSLPGSATAGEAKTSVIKGMQTLRTTLVDESGKGIVATVKIRRTLAQVVEPGVGVPGRRIAL
jgi:hypothetical protein